MIKTITSNDAEDFDEQCNKFARLNNSFATQTHILQHEGQKPLFVAVMFYKSSDDYNRS